MHVDALVSFSILLLQDLHIGRADDGIQASAKEQSLTLHLDNVFGVSSREQALGSLVRRICSSVRNSFRSDVSLL